MNVNYVLEILSVIKEDNPAVSNSRNLTPFILRCYNAFKGAASNVISLHYSMFKQSSYDKCSVPNSLIEALLRFKYRHYCKLDSLINVCHIMDYHQS